MLSWSCTSVRHVLDTHTSWMLLSTCMPIQISPLLPSPDPTGGPSWTSQSKLWPKYRWENPMQPRSASKCSQNSGLARLPGPVQLPAIVSWGFCNENPQKKLKEQQTREKVEPYKYETPLPIFSIQTLPLTLF